jgi:hypothetical protein
MLLRFASAVLIGALVRAPVPASARWDQAPRVQRQQFYERCAKKFPKAVFSGPSRQSIEAIFDYWDRSSSGDRRWLAYILGDAYRETAGTMSPATREGRDEKGKLCATDDCSVAWLTRNKLPYVTPAKNGKVFFGRGFLQLTHADNYLRVGQALGWGSLLYDDPDSVLTLDRGVPILVEGLAKGLVNSKGFKLSDFFNDEVTEWIGARLLVNPGTTVERAAITGEHARTFYQCLK